MQLPPPTTTTFGANSGKTFTFTNGTLEGFTTPKATATKSDDNTDLSNLIEYTSSDADIVAVDSKTGELTFTNTKFGKATITATLPKTDTYQTSTDSYFVENKDTTPLLLSLLTAPTSLLPKARLTLAQTSRATPLPKPATLPALSHTQLRATLWLLSTPQRAQ